MKLWLGVGETRVDIVLSTTTKGKPFPPRTEGKWGRGGQQESSCGEGLADRMWPQYRSAEKTGKPSGRKGAGDINILLEGKRRVRSDIYLHSFAEARDQETSFTQSTQLSLPKDLRGDKQVQCSIPAMWSLVNITGEVTGFLYRSTCTGAGLTFPCPAYW